jgi:hypothetical protein
MRYNRTKFDGMIVFVRIKLRQHRHAKRNAEVVVGDQYGQSPIPDA